MTSQDYIVVSRAVALCYDRNNDPCGKLVVEYIADAMKQQNERFNHDRFIAACKFPELAVD
jgi:hypothetical protein